MASLNEQEGFRPTGRRSKVGRCTLCGARARLTRAHVPPKAAFNNRPFSWGGTTADSQLVYGRPRLGGANLYAHCEPCRAATSPWDDEYIRWAYSFASVLVNSPWKGERTQIQGTLSGVRPGRFIRSALAGMTALAPKLLDSHPDLVQAVRQGTPSSPPDDLRFLVAVAPDGAAATVEGAHEALAVKMSFGDDDGSGWKTETAPTISTVIHFAPFSLLLADRQLAASLPHLDCTEWLELGVDQEADVQIVLPVVDLPKTPDAPVPVSMLQFAEARA